MYLVKGKNAILSPICKKYLKMKGNKKLQKILKFINKKKSTL